MKFIFEALSIGYLNIHRIYFCKKIWKMVGAYDRPKDTDSYGINENYIYDMNQIYVFVKSHDLHFLNTMFSPNELAEFNKELQTINRIYNEKGEYCSRSCGWRANKMYESANNLLDLLKEVTIFHK